MRRIAILNQKGGAGKTTTAANLGVALAELGQQVLLVDMDPNASLSFYFGVEAEEESSTAALLSGEARWPAVAVAAEGCQLLPAHLGLADMELQLATAPDKFERLARALPPDTSAIDTVLIDCPPSLSVLTLNALAAASEVLVPLQPEVLALKGLELMMNTLEKVTAQLNPDLQLLGVLPIMVDKRRKVTEEVISYIRQDLGLPLTKHHVRTDVRIIEAPSFGKSVLSYAPKSNSAMDYRQLAKSLV